MATVAKEVYNPMVSDAPMEIPEADYVALTPTPISDRNAKRDEHRKHRSEACCTCVVLSILIFLTLFFTIPRKPIIWMSKLDVDMGPIGNVTNVAGKFTFENLNYFSMKWSDLKVDLYWLPADNDFITLSCWPSSVPQDEQCEFYYRGFCAIKLGSFADENRFQTGARTWTHRTLALTQTAQEFDCVRNLIRDSVDEWQNLITRGSVLAKGTLRDFGHVNVRDTIYVFE